MYKKSEPRRLTDCGKEEQVKVVGINGGERLRSKLTALGIVPGLTLTVKEKENRGPLLVSLFNETLMINRGMAEKIYIR